MIAKVSSPEHEQPSRPLSREEQGEFEDVAEHFDNDPEEIPQEYAELTTLPSQEELYREALNPKRATSEEWQELDQPNQSPQVEKRAAIEQELREMKARYQETQAMLPPYERAPDEEITEKKPSRLKRFAGFFSRRKGSEEAWHPEQRPVVTTMARGSAAIASLVIQFDPSYPNRRFNNTL